MNPVAGVLVPVALAIAVAFSSLPTYAQEAGRDWEGEYGIVDISVEEMGDIGAAEEVDARKLPDWIGGFFELQRRQTSQRNDHPLNPEGKLLDFAGERSVALLNVKLDPQLSERWRFVSNSHLRYRKTDLDSEARHYLLEGYLQWRNAGQSAAFAIGRLLLEWGSGYRWNPVQLLLPDHDEHSDEIYEDEGQTMLFVEVSAAPFTTTLLLAELDERYSDRSGRYQAAFKLALDLSAWDFALFHHQATGRRASGGLSFSGLLTDALEIHGEWAGSYRKKREVPRKASEGVQTSEFYLPARYEYVASPDDGSSLLREYLLGFQYTFLTDMNLICELYHTDHGYSDGEWNDILDGVEEAHRGDAWNSRKEPFAGARGNPYAGFLKNGMKEVERGDLRRNYLFVRYHSGEFANSWSVEQVLIFNADDSSRIQQSALTYNWQDEWEIEGAVTLFQGKRESEFGWNPNRHYYTVTFHLNY